MKVRIYIDDRTYTKWTFNNLENDEELETIENSVLQSINPLEHKLFSKDILLITGTKETSISHETVYSSTKTNDKIAGVLILENNKTYGRTANKKRLLYKCIPDDKHLPVFLIPYDVKLGFSKFQKNKYVVFRYDHWQEKHPHAIITETIGDVDSLEAFYEYQLHCKSLNISITEFTNNSKNTLKQHTPNEYMTRILETNPNIENHRNERVFTIDPPNSVDFDDGFSITMDKVTKICTITIYIANVYFWLDTLMLWKSFSKRVATIYLPDRRRPMLPTILSDNLCSLQENQPRIAFFMRIRLDGTTGKIVGEPEYNNAIINVTRNYKYEDGELLNNDPCYELLLRMTQKNDKSVKTSNDVVSHWMVFMNKMTGLYMAKKQTGIFRATTYEPMTKREPMTPHDEEQEIQMLNEDTQRVIKSWNNNIGKYVIFEENKTSLAHHMMEGQYIHITSPIRRIVDLLNQMIMFKTLNIVTLSVDAEQFLLNWTEQIEYINTSMRSIRKIQTDCELINRCFKDASIMNTEHVGVVFDKIVKNDGTNHYMVYLEKLKLLSRITTHVDVPVFSQRLFTMFLFEDEYRTKRKIRLQLKEN